MQEEDGPRVGFASYVARQFESSEALETDALNLHADHRRIRAGATLARASLARLIRAREVSLRRPARLRRRVRPPPLHLRGGAVPARP